jgi:hypothetical protein
MCVLIFSTTFIWNTPHLKKKWGRYDQKVYIDLLIRYPIFLPYYNETWILSTGFSNNTLISNFMKICPVGAELFHADRQTANSRFSQFCERAYKPQLETETRSSQLSLRTVPSFFFFFRFLSIHSPCHVLNVDGSFTPKTGSLFTFFMSSNKEKGKYLTRSWP